MKAFILAAGLGTRLRPLTNDRPKALVEIQGKSLLELCIQKLKKLGFSDFIINVHHFADKVEDHLEKHNNFGVNIQISDERDLLLDTGGGLKQIESLLQGAEDVLIHNVDVISDLNIGALITQHKSQNNLATLAMRKRESSRFLEFDSTGQLCQWLNTKTGEIKVARPSNEKLNRFAFSGVHIINSRIFRLMHETGVFSIIDVYLRLAATERISYFDHTESFWKDLGRYSHWESLNAEAKSISFLNELLS